MNEPIFLRHNKIDLALHSLRSGTGRPLLILHGLGDHIRPECPEWASAWPGPVYGLDFTGHGRSTVPVGGGYTAEVLMGDVDAALAHLGPCTLVGFGLGGYIALLLAGARPKLVRGAIIADGTGISGGPSAPSTSLMITSVIRQGRAPDAWALVELARDPRPADYALQLVHQAALLSGLDDPIAVCARFRPPWLAAAADHPAVLVTDLATALSTFASS